MLTKLESSRELFFDFGLSSNDFIVKPRSAPRRTDDSKSKDTNSNLTIATPLQNFDSFNHNNIAIHFAVNHAFFASQHDLVFCLHSVSASSSVSLTAVASLSDSTKFGPVTLYSTKQYNIKLVKPEYHALTFY